MIRRHGGSPPVSVYHGSVAVVPLPQGLPTEDMAIVVGLLDTILSVDRTHVASMIDLLADVRTPEAERRRRQFYALLEIMDEP